MVTESAPLTATARAIEGAFGIPARTIRRWGKAGTVPKAARGQYPVREVLAERDRRDSTGVSH